MKVEDILFIPRNSLRFRLVRFFTSGGYGEEYLPKTRLGFWFTFFGAIVLSSIFPALLGLIIVLQYQTEGVTGVVQIFAFTAGVSLAIGLAIVTRRDWLLHLQRLWELVERILFKPVEYL